MKKSVKSIANILIIFTTIIAILSLYAYSKYIGKLTGNGVSTVAKWSFKVNGESSETQSFNLAETINKTANIQEGVIASGTNGYYDIEIDTRKTKVAVKYEIKMQIENKPQNLHFYTDENYAKILNEDGENIVLTGFIPLEEVDGVRNVRIYWNWPYKTGNTEQEVIENYLKDTEDAGKTMTANITVTGTQAKPESKEVNYTVKYYVENANDDGYTLYQTKTKTGMSETQITLSSIAEDIENAVYSHGSEEENGEKVSNVEIKEDGTTNIYLYYARSRYTLKVKAGEEIKGVKAKGTSTAVNEEEEKEIKEVKFKYGENIELSAILKKTEGYTPTFKEWKVESEIVNSDQSTANGETNSEESTTNESTTETINLGENYNPNSQTTTITMPKQDITITAKATKVESDQTPYTVNYYLENANNEEYTLNKQSTLAGTTNTKITEEMVQTEIANATLERTDLEETTIIKADGSTVVNVYYKRNTYELSIIKGENIKEVSISTGSIENVDNTEENTNNSTESIDNTETSNTENNNTEAKNTENTTITQNIKYGANVNITATTENNEGYTYEFTGWTTTTLANLGANYDQAQSKTQITMPAENIELTATASKTANTYTINFNANSGIGEMSNQTFTYGTAQKLIANTFTKTGYTFKGWATEVGTETVKYENEEEILNITTTQNDQITLYAVWKDETAPELAITTETTTNTITVEVDATETGSGLEENYKYYIGKKDENANIIYSEPVAKPSTTHTFEDLEDNTEHYIKVEIADKAGNIGQTIQTAITQELIGEVTFTNEYWTNGKYVLTVNTETVDKTQTPYKIQYKLVWLICTKRRN